VDHRTDAIRYYGMDLGEGDKTAMSNEIFGQAIGGNPYAQQQLQNYMQQYQNIGRCIIPMEGQTRLIGPKINDLLLLVEEGDV
jgi:hypothetical protein